ncbi:MAG: ERF family protein [Phycisphaerae bacterium]|jgi:hypothetical protein|nr:ERF family protein [Phycisphaerae bacterium]
MRPSAENDWSPPPDLVDSGISMSTEISEIATALNSALSDITDAPKTATAFKYKYAPLDVVMPIVRSACQKHGLFLLQSPWSPERGALGVTTLLTHKSGQWIQTQYAIPFTPDGQNVFHQVGTSTTYLRRYAVMALMMQSAEDDDAVSTEKRKPDPKKYTPPTGGAKNIIRKLTKVAKDAGREHLDTAYLALSEDEKKMLTAADKASLKEIASATH